MSARDIDAASFRETARKAIEKYSDRGQLIDVLVWSRIVGEYEEVVKVAESWRDAVLLGCPRDCPKDEKERRVGKAEQELLDVLDRLSKKEE